MYSYIKKILERDFKTLSALQHLVDSLKSDFVAKTGLEPNVYIASVSKGKGEDGIIFIVALNAMDAFKSLMADDVETSVIIDVVRLLELENDYLIEDNHVGA